MFVAVKKPVNFTLPVVLAEWLDAEAAKERLKYHQKWMLPTAALLMLLEASPERRRHYMREALHADVGDGAFDELMQRVQSGSLHEWLGGSADLTRFRAIAAQSGRDLQAVLDAAADAWAKLHRPSIAGTLIPTGPVEADKLSRKAAGIVKRRGPDKPPEKKEGGVSEGDECS